MTERDPAQEFLAEQFATHRTHLRTVAYRMLGSLSDADDAVQEAWLRLSRTDAAGIDNLGGWLTTVVARLCLNTLQTRRVRREGPLDEHLPDPILSSPDGPDPEQEALLGESVGLAMLVVLETLTPGERLAFVLHDLFAVPFDEIAEIGGRSPAAVRQLASRGRRRVQGTEPPTRADRQRQRDVVDAFLAASRSGNFDALLTILDPDVVLRTDAGPGAAGLSVVLGSRAVVEQARSFGARAAHTYPVLVNGLAGILAAPLGKPAAVMAFTVRDGKVVEIDILADPERLHRLDLSAVSLGG